MKADTFERLYAKCKDSSFLKSENIGKEIPFYIIPYKPNEKKSVSQNVNMIIKRLQEVNIEILKLDLFELCIDILQEQGILADVLELEKDESPKYFLDAFDSALNNDIIADYIQSKIQEQNPDVVFIHGIGKIYPFKRIHPLINNMHSKTENKPIVFFYPGIYDGNTFKLFGLDDGNGGDLFKANYYRAYNLE